MPLSTCISTLISSFYATLYSCNQVQTCIRSVRACIDHLHQQPGLSEPLQQPLTTASLHQLDLPTPESFLCSCVLHTIGHSLPSDTIIPAVSFNSNFTQLVFVLSVHKCWRLSLSIGSHFNMRNTNEFQPIQAVYRFMRKDYLNWSQLFQTTLEGEGREGILDYLQIQETHI